MPTQSLPNNPSLENLRKQAKALRKAVRANDSSAVARVREFHPRSTEALASFSLSAAQLVVARSYAFASWLKLKHHLEVVQEYSWSEPEEPAAAQDTKATVDRLINLACLSYGEDWTGRRDQARELLAAQPSLSNENIYAAATVGDVAAARRMLNKDPALAKKRGGPRNWEPLLYAAYSRLNSNAEGHSTLEVARLLLERGADPNAGFLWDGNYLFTALTGAFGEGERGPINQPEHQYCYQLARLLLEAGADPNDGQALYNRMFTRGTRHLELLFEFGLGKPGKRKAWFNRLGDLMGTPSKMLDDQMGWAVSHHHVDRLPLLLANGVDVNSANNRVGRPPLEIALLDDNKALAEYLVEHGATRVSLSDLDVFATACFGATASEARSMLAKDATLIQRLDHRRVELLQKAASEDRREAVRLMVELGFDVNEVRRTTALHNAASSGHLEMVKLLIELGADPLMLDEAFNARPYGWARYGHQFGTHNRIACGEVMQFLEQYEPQ